MAVACLTAGLAAMCLSCEGNLRVVMLTACSVDSVYFPLCNDVRPSVRLRSVCKLLQCVDQARESFSGHTQLHSGTIFQVHLQKRYDVVGMLVPRRCGTECLSASLLQGNPLVYFDIKLGRYGDAQPLGRIVMELKKDVSQPSAEDGVLCRAALASKPTAKSMSIVCPGTHPDCWVMLSRHSQYSSKAHFWVQRNSW